MKNEGTQKTRFDGHLDHLDVDANTLIAALNDQELSEKLCKETGWTRNDLLTRADLLAKELSASIAAVNVV